MSDVVEKSSTRRRSRIPCVVVEKIMTRRREGVGIVVEKMKKVDKLSTKNKNACDLLTAITHTEIMCALYKTNKQFNKKTKLWKQNGRCLDDVTTALYSPYRKLKNF